MSKIVVQEIDLPSTSLASQLLAPVDFADAFRCRLSENQPQDIDSVTRAIFMRMPQWVSQLLKLRDAIVYPLGLKMSIDAAPADYQEKLRPGTTVGAFEVLDRKQDEEIILGEDDSHLDYRVSVRLEREAESCWVVVSTVVKFNNWLGRAYFVPVKPLHKIIVPAMIRSGLGS